MPNEPKKVKYYILQTQPRLMLLGLSLLSACALCGRALSVFALVNFQTNEVIRQAFGERRVAKGFRKQPYRRVFFPTDKRSLYFDWDCDRKDTFSLVEQNDHSWNDYDTQTEPTRTDRRATRGENKRHARIPSLHVHMTAKNSDGAFVILGASRGCATH